MDSQNLLGTETLPANPPTSDEKTLALLSHILTFIAPLLAPLIIYVIKKDESAFVAAHAKESLNFQITFLILVIILFITVIGILLIWLVGLIATVVIIIASVRAYEGKLYKYPFCIRIIN